jgi:hypothetical protein
VELIEAGRFGLPWEGLARDLAFEVRYHHLRDPVSLHGSTSEIRLKIAKTLRAYDLVSLDLRNLIVIARSRTDAERIDKER